MVSWVDLTPTILDFAGVLEPGTEQVRIDILAKLPQKPSGSQRSRSFQLGRFHGRSFLQTIESPRSAGWDQVFASHTFHEIMMYYPMRVVRGRRYKLIWNLAHPLPFPFASDLWVAPTWQAQFQQGPQASYGAKTVANYLHRPQFELYDLKADPHEGHNLAGDPQHAELLERLKDELRNFQVRTADPWHSPPRFPAGRAEV